MVVSVKMGNVDTDEVRQNVSGSFMTEEANNLSIGTLATVHQDKTILPLIGK